MTGLRVNPDDVKETDKPDYGMDVKPDIGVEKAKEIQGVIEKMSVLAGRPIPKRRMTISVCIITQGEKTLDRAVASAGKFADEIILVLTNDMNSWTPIDPKIKTYRFPWINDFSAARNFAKSKATSDYVMWIDSDDVVVGDSWKYIRAAFDNPGPKTLEKKVMFSFKVTNTVNGEPIGDIFWQPRVIPNIPEVYWESKIHEHFSISCQAAGLENVIETKNIHIHHYGYDSNDAHDKKWKRNLEYLLKEPETDFNLLHLGTTYYAQREFKKARDCWKKIIALYDKTLTDTFRSHVQYLIGQNYFHDEQHDKAMEWLLKSERNDAQYFVGAIYKKQNKKNMALMTLLNYLKMKPQLDPWATGMKQYRYNAYAHAMNILGEQIKDMKKISEIYKKLQTAANNEYPERPAWN